MRTRIERLERLAELRKMGAFSDAEFEAQKAKLLDSTASNASRDQAVEPPDPIINQPRQKPFKIPMQNKENINIVNNKSSFFKRISDILLSSDFKNQISFTGIIVSVIAISWIIYFIIYLLKYIGIGVGICALIYCLVKLKGYDSSGMKTERIQANSIRLWTLLFSSIALIVVSAIIDYVVFPIRPGKSDIAESDYNNQCVQADNGSKCEGKFVLWDGVFLGTSSDDILIKTNSEVRAYIHDIDPKSLALVEGQKIKVSGWLSHGSNALSPDIASGEISPVETKDAAVNRLHQERVASGESYSPAECAEQKQRDHLYSEIERKCALAHDGSGWAAYIVRSSCGSVEYNKLRECGISVDMAN